MRSAFDVDVRRIQEDAALEGGVFEVAGIMDVAGTGVAEQRIRFPILFVEQPTVHWGTHVTPVGATGSGVAVETPPLWTASVVDWERQVVFSGFYYVGMVVMVMVDALEMGDLEAPGAGVTLHWAARGRALVSPPLPGHRTASQAVWSGSAAQVAGAATVDYEDEETEGDRSDDDQSLSDMVWEDEEEQPDVPD